MVLVRVADDEEKPTKPSCVLVPAEESSIRLAGMEGGTWGELVHAKGEYTTEL